MKTMQMKAWMLAAAVAVTLSAGVSFGDILDEGLGSKTPAPAEVKPATADSPAPGQAPADPKLSRPKMADLVNPDAAKTVDDQDLTNKLTGKQNVDGGEAAGPDEKMKEVMERMGQAQSRLTKEKDAGMVTQETQQRIVVDLDAAIEYLKKQEQKGGSKSPPKPGGKPKKGESQGQQSGSAPGSGKGGTTGATNSDIKSGSADAPIANDTNIHQTGTNWGNLPPGDRELVAHGASEHYLPEYQDMIKRYYEALAEIGRNSGNH